MTSSPLRWTLLAAASLACACATPQQKFDAAVLRGDVKTLSKLPTGTVDIESADAAGNTPLMRAASRGEADLMRLLIERGARVDARNGARVTPLMMTADPRLAELLLAKGADVNAQDGEGGTALMYAAMKGRAGLTDLLLERGADAGARDSSGRTALAAAAPACVPALAAAERKLVAADLAAAEKARSDGEARKALDLYMAALGRLTRGSEASRETRAAVVALARSMPEPPEIPEEARKHMVKSQFLLSRGAGRSQVEAEIQAALDAAPWWSDGYYNLGLIQGAQGRYKDAIASLRSFMAGSPDSPQAQAAQDKIYELEISQEQADKIAGLSGTWTLAGNGTQLSVESREGKLIAHYPGWITITATIDGHQLQGSVQGVQSGGKWTCTIPAQLHPVTGRISDDMKSIEYDYVWSTYESHGHCVNMAGAPSNCCLFCSEVCDGVNVQSTTNVHLKLVR